MHEKKSKLAIDDFDTVMRYLGFDCQKNQKVEFEKDELLKMIRSTQERLPRICFQESDLLSDLLKSVPLFVKMVSFINGHINPYKNILRQNLSIRMLKTTRMLFYRQFIEVKI